MQLLPHLLWHCFHLSCTGTVLLLCSTLLQYGLSLHPSMSSLKAVPEPWLRAKPSAAPSAAMLCVWPAA